LEITTEEKIPLNDADITGHCVVFFGAGLETVPSALQFAIYLLALYPEVQERLFMELNQAAQQSGGEFSYGMLDRLEYLNGVISGEYF